MLSIQIPLLIIISLFVSTQSLSLPTWTATKAIKSGTCSLYNASSYNNSKAYTATQIYQQTFTNIPTVIMGMSSFAVSYSNTDVGFANTISSITKTNFLITLLVYAPNITVSQLQYMYFAIDLTLISGFGALTTFISTSNISSGSGIRTHTQQIPMGTTYNLSSSFNVFLSFNGYYISPNGTSFYNLSLTGSIFNTSAISVVVSTSNTLAVPNVTVSILTADTIAIQSTYTYFLDIGNIYGANGAQTSPINTSGILNFYNSIIGLNYLTINLNQVWSFDAQDYYTVIFTATTYVYLQLSAFQLRVRNCSSPDTYYIPSTGYCNSTCDIYLFPNTTFNYCQTCTYSCGTPGICANSQNAACPGFCNSSNNRYFNSLQACVCLNGYYDDGVNLTCDACSYTCYTCTNASTNCTACTSSNQRTISANACPCNGGYYDDGTNSLCATCSYSCLNCSNQSTNCTACSASNFRYISGSSCLCSNGYFQSNVSACSSCDPTCLTCTNVSTNCTGCNSSLFRYLSSTSCLCSSTYYEVGLASCASCSAYCYNCTAAASNCTSCSASNFRTLSTNTCICMNGYFDNGVVACATCDYSCLTCVNSSTVCLTCNSSNLRFFSTSNNSCICNQGYFDNKVGLCGTCNATCLNCSVTATNCTVCDLANNFRVLNNSKCSCTTGYYDDGVNVACQVCISTCLTCVTSNNNCTSCNSSYFRTLNNTMCSCMDGYFQNSTNTCATCPYYCLTCSSNTTCLTCNTSNFRDNDPSNSCPCSQGYFNNNASLCLSCNYTCLTCSISATNCTTCLGSNQRTINGSSCVCMNNYYDSGSALCTSCESTCLTCNGTLNTNCLACDSTLNRILSVTSCPCTSGYFQNSSILCSACDSTCLTCSGTSLNCTSCNSTLNRNLTGNSCGCSNGYYLSGSICLSCNVTCGTCLGVSSNCTSCTSSNNRALSINSCICLTSYFQTNIAACQSCYVLCLTCNGSASTDCLSCNASLFLLYNATTSTCYCITGYFLNTSTNTCNQCDPKCSSCVNSSTNCLGGCSGYPNAVQNGSFCSCIAGYYNNSGVCTSCSSICLTCSMLSTNCTSCGSNNIYSNNTCTCTTGFYNNGATSNCIACYYSCLTCSSSPTNCTSCSSASFRILNNNKCPCQSGYSDIGNSICQNSSTVSSTDSVSSTTVICDYSCATCQDIFTCLTCNSSDFRIYNTTTLKCSCMQYYYDDGTNQVCPEICGDAINLGDQSIYCDDGNLINNDGCSSTCMIQTNWTCTNLPNLTSSCVYNGGFIIGVVSIQKSSSLNSVAIQLSISPNIVQLNSVNFSNIVTINPSTNINLTQYTYSSGMLTITSTYTSSLQNTNVTVSLSPSSSNVSTFSNTSITTSPILIASTNNQPIVYFSSKTYTAQSEFQTFSNFVVYFSLALFAIGSIFLNPTNAVESLAVVQIGFFGVSWVQNVSPYLTCFYSQGNINGGNIGMSSTPTNNERFNSIGYSAYFVSNFNTMIIVMALTPILGYIIYKLGTKVSTQSRILQRYGKKMGYESTLALFLLTLNNFLFSFFIFVSQLNSIATSGSFYTFSVLLIVTLFILYGIMGFVFYHRHNNFKISFKYYRSPFACQIDLLVTVLYKTLMMASLVFGNNSFAMSYVILAIPIAQIGYIALYKPNSNNEDLIRRIFNQVIVLFTLVYYSTTRITPIVVLEGDTAEMNLPIGVLVMEFVTIIVNTSVNIYLTYKLQINNYKISPQSKLTQERIATDESSIAPKPMNQLSEPQRNNNTQLQQVYMFQDNVN